MTYLGKYSCLWFTAITVKKNSFCYHYFVFIKFCVLKELADSQRLGIFKYKFLINNIIQIIINKIKIFRLNDKTNLNILIQRTC